MKLKIIREILKTCAEDTRLRILNLLEGRELTVKAICQSLHISQSVVSKHLSRLRLVRLVSDRRAGNSVYYRLTSKTDSFQYEVTRFIHQQCAAVSAFQEDKKALAKAKKQP